MKSIWVLLVAILCYTFRGWNDVHILSNCSCNLTYVNYPGHILVYEDPYRNFVDATCLIWV